MKQKLLVSACLLGINCKYDGGNNYISEVEQLKEKYELIPICAEILGGLPTPRVPSERRGDRVITKEGKDVTEQFEKGAVETEKIARFFECHMALLKERSPSCGYGEVYDGTFTKTCRSGNGVTAQHLENANISIFRESDIRKLL